MNLLRKFIGNRKCGLRWRHALRAAVLDMEITKIWEKWK